jgi:hypothetical protein
MARHDWSAANEPGLRLIVRERGVAVGAWDITVARDYRGRPSPQRWHEILTQGKR